MKLDCIANSKNDEWYTPAYAITPILKYINPHSLIWCPFDTENSLFVKIFKEKCHEVIYSHIDSGTDFFDCHPPRCDYIISNPPYSCKSKVLNRLFNINIPFAMLVCVVGLFESQERFNMFKNNKFEILYMNRRISYFKDYKEHKPSLNPPFSSVYICSGILPQQIIFEEINKNHILN